MLCFVFVVHHQFLIDRCIGVFHWLLHSCGSTLVVATTLLASNLKFLSLHYVFVFIGPRSIDHQKLFSACPIVAETLGVQRKCQHVSLTYTSNWSWAAQSYSWPTWMWLGYFMKCVNAFGNRQPTHRSHDLIVIKTWELHPSFHVGCNYSSKP